LFDIGWSEMAVILLVALVVIGPRDLPRVARTMGRWVAKGRGMAREFQTALEDMAREAELDKVKSEIEKAGRTNLGKTIENTIDPTGELGKAFDPNVKAGSRKDTAAKPAVTEPAATNAAAAESAVAKPAATEPVAAEPIAAEPAAAKPAADKPAAAGRAATRSATAKPATAKPAAAKTGPADGKDAAQEAAQSARPAKTGAAQPAPARRRTKASEREGAPAEPS
jgi:sec-independent protein translocase protein TatB